MDRNRVHTATSDDGTKIAGRVDGQGPPLVLVHGSLEDGDLCWAAMLPSLRNHFTCYLPSTRSRGLSGESDDLAPQRRVEDVVAFVRSIGAPVRLFGESDGGTLALGAAARTDAVAAVAVYEPVVFEVAGRDVEDALAATLPRVGEAVAGGRLTEAARIFSELIANDDEISALEGSEYFDETGRSMPVLLQELEEDAQSHGPRATDPSLLSEITAPTLVMHGARSARRDWFARGAEHVATHVADAQRREVPDAGHFGVACAPQVITDELVRFFAHAPTPS